MTGWGWFWIFVLFIVVVGVILIIVFATRKGQSALGDPCESTPDCQSGLTCQRGRCRATAGGDCNTITDCASGQSPPLVACLPPSGGGGSVCTSTPPGNGQSCAKDVSGGSCGPGLVCSSGSICLGGAGASCTSNTQCGTGYQCNGSVAGSICVGSAVGSTCNTGLQQCLSSSNLTCATGGTVINTCQVPGSVGTPCTSNSNCTSPLTCSIPPGGTTGSCSGTGIALPGSQQNHRFGQSQQQEFVTQTYKLNGARRR